MFLSFPSSRLHILMLNFFFTRLESNKTAKLLGFKWHNSLRFNDVLKCIYQLKLVMPTPEVCHYCYKQVYKPTENLKVTDFVKQMTAVRRVCVVKIGLKNYREFYLRFNLPLFRITNLSISVLNNSSFLVVGVFINMRLQERV